MFDVMWDGTYEGLCSPEPVFGLHRARVRLLEESFINPVVAHNGSGKVDKEPSQGAELRAFCLFNSLSKAPSYGRLVPTSDCVSDGQN